MVQIDKKSYKIDDKNFYKSKYDKKQIILAGSLRKSNFHIKRLSKKEFGLTKKWPTFTISREGKIYQHFDPKYYSDFMGDKDVDKTSISVVLENMGWLFYDYQSDKYLNSLHEECEEANIFERKWNGGTYWERYTNEQFESVVELCKHLCDTYGIELDTVGHNVFYEDTKNFDGIVSRSNYSMDILDLNPSFNFNAFMKELDIETE